MEASEVTLKYPKPTFRLRVPLQRVPKVLHGERAKALKSNDRHRILQTPLVSGFLDSDPVLARCENHLKV